MKSVLDCLAGSWSADQINQAVKAYEAGRRHGVAVGHNPNSAESAVRPRNQRRYSIEGESVIQKAISVCAPWWWFILHGGKTHENRDWTSFRGSVLLHASKWWNQSEVEEDRENAIWMMEHTRKLSEVPLIDPPQMKAAGGSIVGSVEIIDCVTESESPWFRGKFGFQLANPIAFPSPIPCKGALEFFEPSKEVLAHVPHDYSV